MRPIDWQRLLREHRIPYIESGANVKRGELAIQCPFCGSADPSKHMGLSLETGWWSCWRNRSQHSGKSPLRLIMRLLGVPYGRAREIAGLGEGYIDPEGFDALAARILQRGGLEPSKTDDQEVATKLRLRLAYEFSDFDLIQRDRARTRSFWEYLCGRGFDGKTSGNVHDVDRLCELYELRAGVSGSQQGGRIVLPYIQDGDLVAWSGRAIAPSAIRYRDLDHKDCLVPPKDTLFNHDAMYDEGRALILQEGPFDVLKLDYYGRRHGVRSVGLSTNSLSSDQAFLLQTAQDHYTTIVVMLDTKSRLGLGNSMAMKQQLDFLSNVRILPVPFEAGDGGAMTKEQVASFCQQF